MIDQAKRYEAVSPALTALAVRPGVVQLFAEISLAAGFDEGIQGGEDTPFWEA